MIARLLRLYHRAARTYWGTIVGNQALAGVRDEAALRCYCHHADRARLARKS